MNTQEKTEKKSNIRDFFSTVAAIIFFSIVIGIISILIINMDLKLIIAFVGLWIAWSIDLLRQELLRIRKTLGKNKFLLSKYLNRRGS